MSRTGQTDRYTLWGDPRSGNCWKAAQVLMLTGRPFDWRIVDVLSGETRSEHFLAMNPNGKVPLLVFPDGRCLAESNAMLLYLAEGTELIPEDDWDRAQAWQWLFFEQYSHEPYVAVARFLRVFDHGQPMDPERMDFLKERGDLALGVMDRALQSNDFLAGQRRSVADIALFAYTHVASDGGFELGEFPSVMAWLERMRQQPGHVDMADLDVPA